VLVVLGADALLRRRAAPGRGRTRLPAVLVALCVLTLGALTLRRSVMYREPESLYLESIERMPRNYRAYGNLGDLMESAGRTVDARNVYELVLALDSTYAFPYERLAELALREGRIDDARSILDAGLRFGPDHPPFLARYGLVLGLTRSPAAGIPYLERAVAAGSTDPATMADLAMLYSSAGRANEAIGLLQRSLALSPLNVGTRSFLGYLMLEAGRAPDAVSLLEQSVRAAPGSPLHRARLAVAYAEIGQRDAAAAAAESALGITRDDPQILSLCGIALARSGRTADARALLERALSMDPADDNARRTLASLPRL
jgi:tetratricopeptide (TPR) repeat protein